MIKLALLNPPGELGNLEYSLPPLGLGYIASYLRQYYGKLDIKIYNNLDETIKFKPDIIGITGYTQNFEIVKKMCLQLKQKLEVPIIIGGHHITTVPQSLPDSCDIGVMGEGEETMHQLMLNYERFGFSKESLRSIKGIVFKDGSLVMTDKRDLIEPLDKIPFPARDLFELKTNLTHIMTSRGCPYRCIFCSSSIFWKRVRMFTPEYVVNEIEHIAEKYHIDQIWMYDDLFILDKERLEKISELIEKRNLNRKISFSVQTRVNLISDEICRLLKKMNVIGVSFGFESGSENVLQSLKGETVSIMKAKKAIQICKKYDFSISGGFILGSPNETRKDVLDSIKFYKNAPIGHTQISIATPLPGTYLWDYALKKNLVSYDMDWSILNPYITDPSQILNRNIILSNSLSKKDLYELFLKFQSEIEKKKEKPDEQVGLLDKILKTFQKKR